MEQLSQPPKEKELPAPNEKLLRSPTFREKLLKRQGKAAKWLSIGSIIFFILLLISTLLLRSQKSTIIYPQPTQPTTSQPEIMISFNKPFKLDIGQIAIISKNINGKNYDQEIILNNIRTEPLSGIGSFVADFVFKDNDKKFSFSLYQIFGYNNKKFDNLVIRKEKIDPFSAKLVITQNEIIISNWNNYDSNFAKSDIYKNLGNPFSFKYPQNWFVAETKDGEKELSAEKHGLTKDPTNISINWFKAATKGGVEIYSFKPEEGYFIGTLPDGEFKVEIIPDEQDKSKEDIKSWCQSKLLNATYANTSALINEFIAEKYIKIDNNDSYLIDYSAQGFSNINGRQICLEKKGTKFMIRAFPLNADYLKTFDQILSTFKFLDQTPN